MTAKFSLRLNSSVTALRNNMINQLVCSSLHRQIRSCLMSMCIFLFSTLAAQDLANLDMKNPVRLSSGIAVQTSFYSVSEIPYRRQPFNWSLSGTPVLHLYGMSMPFSFYVSNQQLGFQQPFNQFGISPRYKWITGHLGYSSVRFSDYTLAGRRFLGAGAEMNPGRLRLGFVYGRFQKPVEQDSVVQATPQGYLSGVPNGAFARKGYAVKVGIGKDKNFFDLVYMRAADDTNSLNLPLSLETLAPERNQAMGFRHRFSGKSGLYWESDAALSFYTRNDQAEPLDTNDIPLFLYRWFDPKLTSQLTYAANSRLGLDGKNVKSSIRYRRISRDFKTMGAYYFQTDLEEYALQVGTGLWKKRLQLRGNIGIQRNNLGEQRQHTTRRVIASLYAGAQITRRLRSDVLFSNFGITQRPTLMGLSDSIRIDQVLQSWQISANYQIPSSRPQSVTLQFNTQNLAPREAGSAAVIEMKAINTTGIYTITLPTEQLSFSVVGQGLWNKQINGTLSSIGGGITASKGFSKGKLNTQAGLRIFNTSYAELEGGATTSIDAGVTYRVNAQWSTQANIRYVTSAGSGQIPGQPFNESLITLSSQLHF